MLSAGLSAPHCPSVGSTEALWGLSPEHTLANGGAEAQVLLL